MVNWSGISRAVWQNIGLKLDSDSARTVGGGDIHRAYCLDSARGQVFLKINTAQALDQLLAESAGLRALADAGAVRVPAVFDCGEAGGWAYLLMEWLDMAPGRSVCGARLGVALAHMHRVTAPGFGLDRDNFIGASLQPNAWSRSWPDFFRERRLGFQLQLAADNGMSALSGLGQRLLPVLDRLFESYQPEASLLHGDLWAGNWGCLTSGEPVLYDPAVYYGDRESDLAMTRLFGGFDAGFYEAYEQSWPLASGWRDRCELYQLYHVLNHANLFGGAYARDAERRIRGLLQKLD